MNATASERGRKIVGLLCLSSVVPFNLQNYFYGITDVKIAHYVLATFVGTVPGTLHGVKQRQPSGVWQP